MIPIQSRISKRSAMTLLELILALFISSLVMIAIGMAMQLQAMAVDSRRNVVEEVQLARAILRQISDDLRSAARYEELTISDSSEALSTEPSATSTGGATGGATGGEASTTDAASDQATGAVDALDVENSTSTTSIPGVFGNQFQLQVDVSRLPRIDEYQPLLPDSAGGMITVPSGFRTVAYYVGTQVDPLTGEQVTGLIRRELDRTITQFATESGNVASINAQGDLLAAEVTSIEFRYFDGTQFLQQWDSAASTTLPLAVEINLYLRPPVSGRNAGARDQQSTLYRMVVAIPTGEYPPDTSTDPLATPDPAASSAAPTGAGAASGTAAAAGGS